jgi:lipoprotein-anchoring transpeptidase ErfK/SrfK
MMHFRVLLAFLPVLLMACDRGGADADGQAQPAHEDGRMATAYAGGTDRLSQEELEAGRLDMDWRQWVPRNTARDTGAAGAGGRDTTAAGATGRRAGGSTAASETWDRISAQAVNSGPITLPLSGDVSGASVLRVQVLLDRAGFRPGIIDGRWGRNTEKAVYWLQEREGLEPTGEVDQATWQRLTQLAGATRQLIVQHRLTADDVAGPFVELPAEWYDRRDMDCQCYESLAEKLAERFHTSESLLEQLNPGADLNALQAGATLTVPAVLDAPDPGQGRAIASIVVSDGGRHLHALDEQGRIIYHFPATLGSAYSPSPTGDFRITAIAHDPTWHYQPELLEGVDDDEPSAVLPPGPNNAVGVVWMQLNRPHYGIHGTAAPETIGYATSNGCVRLTNWDADFLSRRVPEGTPVQFRDVTR